MSDFEDVDDDFAVLETPDGSDDADTFGYAAWAKHSEITTEGALALQKTRDNIKGLTTNEFLIEASEHAAMLKNMLGDADGVVAESCQAIMSNLTVVSTEVSKDPVGFILSFARAIEDDAARKQWVVATVERLQSYVDNS